MRPKPVHLVAALVAAAVVYGLDAVLNERAGLAGDEPATPAKDSTPKWWDDALAEMRATKSPGVALVLPADKAGREKLRAEIEELLKNAPFEAQMHLVEAVYVIADGFQVGAQKGETAVLLDESGKRIAGASVRFTVKNFAADIRPLLRAGERLAARAKAARTPEIEKALAALDADAEKEAAKIDAAVARLAERFATEGPAVIEAYEAAPQGERKSRLFWAISAAFARRRGDQGTAAEKPLPFGVRWKKNALPEPVMDPCPPCGMMMVRPRDRDVLELLAARDTGAVK